MSWSFDGERDSDENWILTRIKLLILIFATRIPRFKK